MFVTNNNKKLLMVTSYPKLELRTNALIKKYHRPRFQIVSFITLPHRNREYIFKNVLMLVKSKCYEVSSTTVKLRSSALGLIRGRQIGPNYIRN